MTYTEQMNILIAQTLEKLQNIDPECYGMWYSKLYPPFGDNENWNVNTLHALEQLLIDCVK
jgi:hypothetical protein